MCSHFFPQYVANQRSRACRDSNDENEAEHALRLQEDAHVQGRDTDVGNARAASVDTVAAELGEYSSADM